MNKLVSKTIDRLGNEPFEVYWLAGLTQNARGDWFVRVVLRGTESGTLHMKPMPIGMLPILSLGVRFEHGEYKLGGARGEIGTATIENVAQAQTITSADVPPELYDFRGHRAGVQKLFRYPTANGEVLIPVVELVRYLFLHNRTLATAIMRPGALNLLFDPQAPGYQEKLDLRFTREMPHRCLSRRFVKEFAWIALDPEARRAWDSVHAQTAGRDYVMFSPPSIEHSTWRFRGIRYGSRWLVLELQSLSGRRLPCAELGYVHPRFECVVRVKNGVKSSGRATGIKRSSADCAENIVYEIDDGEDGSKANRNLRSVDIASKAVSFENPVTVKRSFVKVERSAGANGSQWTGITVSGKGPDKRIIKVSAGERADMAALPPLDFRLLIPARPETMGDLVALDETVRLMRDRLPRVGFARTLVQLKSGRAVSSIGEVPRPAMVITIRPPSMSPIVLIDVERTGISALSLMALKFRSHLAISELEIAVKKTLDGLVDAGGYWARTVERDLSEICLAGRLPRLIYPRAAFQVKANLWALKLIVRLDLNDY